MTRQNKSVAQAQKISISTPSVIKGGYQIVTPNPPPPPTPPSDGWGTAIPTAKQPVHSEFDTRGTSSVSLTEE